MLLAFQIILGTIGVTALTMLAGVLGNWFSRPGWIDRRPSLLVVALLAIALLVAGGTLWLENAKSQQESVHDRKIRPALPAMTHWKEPSSGIAVPYPAKWNRDVTSSPEEHITVTEPGRGMEVIIHAYVEDSEILTVNCPNKETGHAEKGRASGCPLQTLKLDERQAVGGFRIYSQKTVRTSLVDHESDPLAGNGARATRTVDSQLFEWTSDSVAFFGTNTEAISDKYHTEQGMSLLIPIKGDRWLRVDAKAPMGEFQAYRPLFESVINGVE